ncbi:sigma factor [Oscillatoria amoena NRMC-F 0135]|nr:sigma factor [Oscillatoria amoena NRMC-F 0135]
MRDNPNVCDERGDSGYFRRNNPEDLLQEAFARLWANCAKVTPEKAKAFCSQLSTTKC